MKQLGSFSFLQGLLTLTWEDDLVTGISLGKESVAGAFTSVPGDWQAYLRRLPLHAEEAPFRWEFGGTEFQSAVWRGLLEIPSGEVVTYGELARRLERPEAVRAVAAACGANRLPVLVPCHRVVAASGALHGFSAGLDWKRQLLEAEGVSIDSDRLRIAHPSFIV